MADYKGKVVTITGAASGLGKGMAARFGEKGARLSLADLDAENLGRLEAELKGKKVEVMTTVLDVRDGEAVDQFAERTFAAFGGVDYCINNAGVHSMGTIWRIRPRSGKRFLKSMLWDCKWHPCIFPRMMPRTGSALSLTPHPMPACRLIPGLHPMQ